MPCPIFVFPSQRDPVCIIALLATLAGFWSIPRSEAHVVAPSSIILNPNGHFIAQTRLSDKAATIQAVRPSSFPRSTDAFFPPSSPKAFTTPESIASTATVSPHPDRIHLANQNPRSYISRPGMLCFGKPSWLIVLYAVRL